MDNIKIYTIDGNKLVEDLEKNKYWIIFKNYLGEEIESEIPKDIFDELFTEMENWKKEAHQYKEVIDKTINYIMNTDCVTWDNSSHEDLLSILKEVE